jgi:hypothetical protein
VGTLKLVLLYSMIVYDIINDIIDVCHDGYRYLSNIKCIYVGILSLVISIDICRSKNMDIVYKQMIHFLIYMVQ